MPQNGFPASLFRHCVTGAEHHGYVPFKEAKNHSVIVVFNLRTRIKVYTAVVQELHELLKSGPHILTG